ETEPRGVYCGAIGYIGPKGNAVFNVAIRTPVVFRDGTGEMGIGSGVVYDSEADKEYDECLLKLKFLTDPPKNFELIETLLHQPGEGYVLRERHLQRLASSAHFFHFPYDAVAVIAALDGVVRGREGERLRVRLLLAEDGRVSVTSTPMPAQAPDLVMRYVVSDTRLSAANPFLYHKTTRREVYDTEWQAAHDSRGADEVIYLNEHGELAEGSRTNIFIEKDGRLLTPPLDAGLLPGTLRAELLASGKAVESRLTLDDLERADAVFLGNSVRGLVRAEPVG
ncbi:MAG: aminotransferase class IV, partial [Hyphomicrobiaceae bacterium]|nr:aminotransferase class IV [Hyphomicrobiaceae bacterium]